MRKKTISLSEAISRISKRHGAVVEKLCHGRVRFRAGTASRIISQHEAVSYGGQLTRDGRFLREKNSPVRKMVKRLERSTRNSISMATKKLAADPDCDVVVPAGKLIDRWYYD